MFKKLNLISKIPTVSLSTFNLCMAVWLTIGLNFLFFEKLAALTPHSGFQYFLFIIASAGVIISVYNLIFQMIHWKINAKLFSFFWITLGGLSAYFVNSLGAVINSDQIQNMMQTDHREAFDLVNLNFLIWVILFIALPLMVLFIVKIKPEKIKPIIFKKMSHIVASVLILMGLVFVYYVDYAAIFRENRDLKGMISPQNVVGSSWSYYKKQRPQENLPLIHYGEDAHLIQNATNSTKPKIMLLVVGETARAESFSLNGYAKQTNPELSKLDLINFSNVSSCGTATAVSVPCMFSGMTRDRYDSKLAHHREGLLDIAQRAGYKVTWIDNNSGCKDVCNRVEQFKIPTALKDKWCSPDGECFDEILVDSLKDYLKQLPKNDQQSHLIVLHQMGSHGPTYYKRSPTEFQRFKPTCDTNAIQGCSQEELLNSYDNSILYTDHVLSQLIGTLKEKSQYQTAFWYLSDHGESTGESGLYLHGAPYAIAPSQQTHIPMFMWFSQQWQENQPSDVNCLSQLKKSTLSQDNLFPTLINLLGIKTNTADPHLNMLQQCQKTTAPRA